MHHAVSILFPHFLCLLLGNLLQQLALENNFWPKNCRCWKKKFDSRYLIFFFKWYKEILSETRNLWNFHLISEVNKMKWEGKEKKNSCQDHFKVWDKKNQGKNKLLKHEFAKIYVRLVYWGNVWSRLVYNSSSCRSAIGDKASKISLTFIFQNRTSFYGGLSLSVRTAWAIL